MSTNPISFRTPFESQMAKLPPEHQHIIRTTWNAITDLQGAIPLLKDQINSNKSAVAAVKNTANTTTNSETIITNPSTIGGVNDQTGNTAYTSQQSDYGLFVLLGDTSPVAVTLNTAGTIPGITLPWYAIFINVNTGLATLTPATGTITYSGNLAAASLSLPEWYAAIVGFDGTNFWAVVIPTGPQNTPSVTSEWLNSYNAVTGIFGQTQPAFTDISGTVAASQLPNPTTTTLGGVEANTPIAHEWVNAINNSGVPQLSQPAAIDVIPASSTTGGRPTGVAIGYMDFDTTLGIPIWWNGSAWVNASGTPV